MYYYELLAVTEAVERFSSCKQKLRIAIDSAAARGMLKHGSHPELRVNELLRRVFAAVGFSYETIFIYSEDNVADVASRRENLSPNDPDHCRRLDRTRDLLTGAISYTYAHKHDRAWRSETAVSWPGDLTLSPVCYDRHDNDDVMLAVDATFDDEDG